MTNIKISELRSGQANVDVEGVIRELGEKRSFNKYGKSLSVTNAILEDDSGNIKLTLWNDDAIRFKEGDRVKILNGYVNEFQGEKQLTSGKFGKIEKVSGNITANEEEEPDKNQKKKDLTDETKAKSRKVDYSEVSGIKDDVNTEFNDSPDDNSNEVDFSEEDYL